LYICTRVKEVIYTANFKKRRQLENTAKIKMKTSTTVSNNITNKSSKNFEKNVAKLLPEGVTEINLSSCGMKRASGYGSYHFFLDVKINDSEYFTFTKHTNSSPAWDAWTGIEAGTMKHDNFNKATALMLLEENQDLIIEYLNQDNE
jgi:hypothetical protein